MSNSIQHVSPAINEPILSYRPGSTERAAFEVELKRLRSEEIDVPMIIDGKEVRTDEKVRISPPYEHAKTLGHFNRGGAAHVNAAIDAALKAKKSWAAMPWSDRAAIFLRAADLISGPRRAYISACTMLAQSKNIYQAEIDAVAEWADFLRFNANYMEQIYGQQPQSSPTIWNQLEYRPLEGFVFAVTPFNFTAIAGNLPGAPAMMGNTVVWKPADSQIYSAIAVMNILAEAGLPPGVINLIYPEGPVAGDIIFKHKEFAGLHFTGSTGVFNQLWKTIGENISHYKSYPRIVGETGGKDFIMVHKSADADQVATAMLRGAFEFQGQKCSAASRCYVPASLWPAVKAKFVADTKTLKMGTPENFSNFINAVIDERSFDKIASYIDRAHADKDAEIICGGTYDKSEGYFVAPTAIVTTDPKYLTMCEEIFGPVLSIYVYEDEDFSATLKTLDETSQYALTGSIFSNDRAAVLEAREALVYAAGNFYINDKPTGAVVGQQPFGGSRASGTNDKAGSILNLYRWVSPRTIKENFVPPTDYRYPFLGE